MTKPLSGPAMRPHSGAAPKQVMVLLHGYGSDGSDLISLGYHWGPMMPNMLFVSPDAPNPCAINPAGYEWFPLDVARGETWTKGAPVAREVIVNFLIDLWAQTGLKAKDTFLVGFSQGAMMALHTGLSLDEKLAGVVGFSGALIPPDGLEEQRVPKPDVALIHGDLDQMVEPRHSQEASATLQRLGYDVSYHRSPTAGHGISPDMLDFATGFILARLAGATD